MIRMTKLNKNNPEIKGGNLRIIPDMDDTMNLSVNRIIELFNQEYQFNYNLEHFYDWNLAYCINDTNVHKYYSKEGFFRDLKPIKDAIEIVTKLIEEEHHIVIASSVKTDEGKRGKREWLKDYFGDKIEEIHLTTGKSYIEGDIIIDDGLHNLDTSKATHKWLFDRPWNRKDNRYIRVCDWIEIYNKIKSL